MPQVNSNIRNARFFRSVSNVVTPPSIPVIIVAPEVTGELTVGSVLSSTSGGWGGFPQSFTFTYVWKRGTTTVGTNSPNYTLVTADIAANMHCEVSAVNSTGSSASPAVSNSVGPVVAAPIVPAISVAPVISGSQLLGGTLTSTTGTWTQSPTSYAYQWQRNGIDRAGQITNTYVLLEADQDQSIRCMVTATNAAGASTPAASNVLTGNFAPVRTGNPSIPYGPVTGVPQTCDPGTSSGSAPITANYQWRINGAAISGATNQIYTPVVSDEGKGLDCRVYWSNAYGSSSSYPTNQALVYPAVAPPANTVLPHISGTPQVGVQNECSQGTWTGYPAPSYTYQWQADGVDIPSATTAIFIPLESEVGEQLTCVVTATNTEGSTDATSNVTPPVENAQGTGGTVTWNPDDKDDSATLTNGNRTVTGGPVATARSTLSHSSGKRYFEQETQVSNSNADGMIDSTISVVQSYFGNSTRSIGWRNGNSASIYFNAAVVGVTPAGYVNGCRTCLAIDLDAKLFWLAWDGGAWTNDGNPATGVGGISFAASPTVDWDIGGIGSHVTTLCAHASQQTYAPPAGFTAWDSEINAWNPADLFLNNENGVWFDPSDLFTMDQTTVPGSQPITASGQTVRYIGDKSPNVHDATNGGAGAIYREAGATKYLEFNGTNTELAFQPANMAAGKGFVTLVVAAYANASAVEGVMLHVSRDIVGLLRCEISKSTANVGTFSNRRLDSDGFIARSGVTSIADASHVIIVEFDYDADTGALYIDGSVADVTTSDLNTSAPGPTSNTPSADGRLGSRSSNGRYFNGRLYGALSLDRELTATEKISLISWLTAKMT